MRKKAVIIWVAASAIFWAGCGAEGQMEARTTFGSGGNVEVADDDRSGEEEQAGHGVVFKEGHGLQVPAATGKRLGLRIVDVEAGQAKRRIDLALRVFAMERSGEDEFALASAAVSRDEGGFLKPGMKVKIHSAGTGGAGGEVVRVEPASAKVTGLAEVIVRLPADEVKVGEFLDGSVAVASEEEVVVIPKAAVLKTAEGYFAYVVNGESLFRTEIGLGGKEGGVVEVTGGLYAGDQVVLEPIMALWMAELQAIRGGESCVHGH